MDVTAVQLRYFLAVAEELHFTRAAERSMVTTPSLSQQIAILERKLGTELFRRTSRHVELTDAGVELIPLARDVVEAFDTITAWNDARRTDAASVRPDRIGAPHDQSPRAARM